MESSVNERAAELEQAKDAFFRAYLENNATVAWMKDAEGRYVYISPNYERRFGVRLEDWLGKTDFELWQRSVAEQFRENDRAVLNRNSVIEAVEEARIVDGSSSWWLSYKFPYQDVAGKRYVGGLAVEITERKRAEQALRDREHEFRLLADNVPAFYSRIDGELRYRFVNKRYEEYFGRPVSDIVGKHVKDLMGEANFQQIEPHLMAALAGRPVSFTFPLTTPHRDVRWMDVHYTPDVDENSRITGILVLVNDMTEQKRVEQALHESQLVLQEKREELQMLTEKLLTAQEEERRGVARDLHDDFSQRLAALVLEVASLERQPPVLPELIPQALQPIREQLEQLSDDIHNLAYKLHPSLLNHAGLQPAIEDHLHHVSERTGLQIILKVRDVPSPLSLGHSICLFRVLQESLQNIVKHADATGAIVRLSGSSNGIGLSVADNGKGFDTSDKSAHRKGLGLISMQERLRLLNGFLRIHSRPAGGTKVCAWIPSSGRP